MRIEWAVNAHRRKACERAETLLSPGAAEKAARYDRGFRQYSETPLRRLDALASFLGLGGIYVKDESGRFGLKSFKVLGGMYALGNCIAEKLGRPLETLRPDDLKAENTRSKVGELVFATTTDGNHGKGVAWFSTLLGYRSVVYMPAGSSKEREENIRRCGAKTLVTDRNYDDTVRLLTDRAKENGWTVVQDTAWDGYTKIPEWIIQGYSVMARETFGQIEAAGLGWPTHILLQAGVGAFASSIAGFFAANAPQKPLIAVVEPDKAACLYRSAKNGSPQKVGGAMDTIMCGLACGEPNPIGWEILRDTASVFVSVPDQVTARGMRIYSSPLAGDPRVESGESGAVTMGLLSLVMQEPALAGLKQALALDKNSRVLLVSTEGATDTGMYRRVVWDGAYPWTECGKGDEHHAHAGTKRASRITVPGTYPAPEQFRG